MKLLSIIVPLYNQRKLVLDCLNSIISLSLLDYEIIVWNDGSTDGGSGLVEDWINTHKVDARLVNFENHGVSFARNNALKEAQGTYIWFVDSDDKIISDECPSLIYCALNNDADMVYFHWKAFDGQNYSSGLHSVPYIGKTVTGKDLFLKNRLMLSPWCYIYKKSFLTTNNLFFNEKYKTCEDILFNQKALLFANRVITSDAVAYIYTVQSNSASQGPKRSYSVLRDQVRRLLPEIVFYSKQGEFRFLFRVLYLNFREIALWTKKCFR